MVKFPSHELEYRRKYKDNKVGFREEAARKSREYYHKNLDKCKEQRRIYNATHKAVEARKRYREACKIMYPERRLYSGAKHRAKSRQIEFELDITDIVIPKICPICLIPLHISDRIANDNSPTLDRIDNTKGYLKDNSRVISRRANMRKSDFTLDEIKRLYQYSIGEI